LGDSCTDLLSPTRVKFGVLEQTQGLYLHAKFHLNVFIVSASQNIQFLANFEFFGVGAPVPTPFTDEGQIWCTIGNTQCTVTYQISSRSVYCVALCWQKPPIFPVFVLDFLAVSPIGSSLRNLNTGAQLQTFSYPTASKSFLYSIAFMAKSGAQSLTFKSVTNNQTDKKSTFWPPRRRVKSMPHQTWHGDRGRTRARF